MDLVVWDRTARSWWEITNPMFLHPTLLKLSLLDGNVAPLIPGQAGQVFFHA